MLVSAEPKRHCPDASEILPAIGTKDDENDTFFGLVALILACIGLYGIVSYSVNVRTREIGARMALGARRSEVLTAIMRETALLTAMGVVIGLAAVFGVTRFIATLLHGIGPTDPVTIAGSVALMAIVAAVAGYIPAHRVAVIDPMVTLRHE